VILRGRIDGLAQLSARLSAMVEPKTLAGDLRETAEEIRERAVADLGEGPLAGSVSVETDGDDGFVVGTPLEAGWHREFGSLKRPASPWLAPPADAARAGLVARIAARLRRAVPKG
jgi:hypothetical protein